METTLEAVLRGKVSRLLLKHNVGFSRMFTVRLKDGKKVVFCDISIDNESQILPINADLEAAGIIGRIRPSKQISGTYDIVAKIFDDSKKPLIYKVLDMNGNELSKHRSEEAAMQEIERERRSFALVSVEGMYLPRSVVKGANYTFPYDSQVAVGEDVVWSGRL